MCIYMYMYVYMYVSRYIYICTYYLNTYLTCEMPDPGGKCTDVSGTMCTTASGARPSTSHAVLVHAHYQLRRPLEIAETGPGAQSELLLAVGAGPGRYGRLDTGEAPVARLLPAKICDHVRATRPRVDVAAADGVRALRVGPEISPARAVASRTHSTGRGGFEIMSRECAAPCVTPGRE